MENITKEQADIIGEVANICTGTAATALSMIINRSTNITTPLVEVLDKENTLESDNHILVKVPYTSGLDGTNLMVLDVQEALKLGKKEYKACVSQGRFPYLPVLDDILSRENIQTEQNMGLMQIPLDFVVGTATKGRTYSFAANFMPILDVDTEFAFKWTALSDAQVNEGIRDPIIAYEYMNRYYVVEGNKRVSVLKYFKADSIVANVTRKIPKYSEDEDVKLYYEYMKFNQISGLNNIEFSKTGMADKLLALMGSTAIWDADTRMEFNSLVNHFTKAYEFRGGRKLPIRVGDALTAFINVYGYHTVLGMSDDELSLNIVKCWNEFVMLTEKQSVGLVMDPLAAEERKGRSIFSYFMPSSAKKFTVAFLYPHRGSA
jgi:basic membrane protein A and related proteins